MSLDTPPEDSLPTNLGDRCTLVRTPDVLIGVDRLRVWPQGVQFTLAVRLRRREPAAPLPELIFYQRHSRPDTTHMQLTVVLPDGTRIAAPSDGEAAGVTLRGGSGGGFGPADSPGAWFDIDWWLWPRPSGSLTFEVECPPIGLPPSSGSISLAATNEPEPITFLED